MDLVPEIGVIDAANQTMYVVAATKESGKYVQRLHALDLATGQEKRHSPVRIQASVKGRGAGNVNGVIHFDALRNGQRAGLLLLQNVVYIAWASHCDLGPYQGWIMGYDARTLKQVAVFNAAIWQSGCGLSADAHNYIYGVTGNGTFDLNRRGGRDSGDTVLKLDTRLKLVDYFTPFNQACLNARDADLGSCGALTIFAENATTRSFWKTLCNWQTKSSVFFISFSATPAGCLCAAIIARRAHCAGQRRPHLRD